MIKVRQPWYDKSGKFSHFSYWGRISDGVFVSPSQCNFAEAREDEAFTETVDRDGIELWDGDIVLLLRSLGYQSNKGDIGYICKDNSELGFVIMKCIEGYDYGYPLSKLTVARSKNIKKIGNRHENPELFK